MRAPANMDPDVINNSVCDWIANYSVLVLTSGASISHNSLSGTYVDKHLRKQFKHFVVPINFV